MAVVVALAAFLLVAARLIIHVRLSRLHRPRFQPGSRREMWSKAPLSRRIGVVLALVVELPLILYVLIATPVGDFVAGSPLARACGGLVSTVIIAVLASRMTKGK